MSYYFIQTTLRYFVCIYFNLKYVRTFGIFRKVARFVQYHLVYLASLEVALGAAQLLRSSLLLI